MSTKIWLQKETAGNGNILAAHGKTFALPPLTESEICRKIKSRMKNIRGERHD
ncbi:MAG: hypothetical protein V8R27_06490 [Oscillospiraceae bacterium]